MLQRFNTKIAKKSETFLPQKMQWWFFCNFVPKIKKFIDRIFFFFFLSFCEKKSYLSDFVLTVNQTLSRLSSHFSASFQPIGFLLLIFIWWNWTKSRLKYCTDFFILQILSSEYSSSAFYEIDKLKKNFCVNTHRPKWQNITHSF